MLDQTGFYKERVSNEISMYLDRVLTKV